MCWIMAHWCQERAQEAAKEQQERSNATSLRKQAAKLVDEVEAHPRALGALSLLSFCQRIPDSDSEAYSSWKLHFGLFLSSCIHIAPVAQTESDKSLLLAGRFA